MSLLSTSTRQRLQELRVVSCASQAIHKLRARVLSSSSASETLEGALSSPPDLRPPDALLVSRGLHALARKRSINEGAWRAHLDRAALACDRAEAEGAALVLNACAKSPVKADEVARLYVDRARRLIPQSNVRHLAIVVNSLARLRIRDEKMLTALARELRGKFAKCSVRDACVIANAYARLSMAERILFGQLIPNFAMTHYKRFRIKDLVQVLNAYAKLQLRSVVVFDALAERCRDQVEHMDCHAVSVIANAHARLTIPNDDLFAAFANRLRACARTCTLQAVSNILHAYARFGSGAGLGDVVESSAGLGGLAVGVFNCMMDELHRFRDTMTPQSLCVIAHAAARVQQHRRQPGLLPILAEHALSLKFQSFEASQLSMISISFAEMWPLVDGLGHQDQNANVSTLDLITHGEGEMASLQTHFWVELAAAASNMDLLGPCDSANCAVAFAVARLGAEKVATLNLAQHCKEEPAPQVAIAILVAYAVTQLWDKLACNALSKHVPELLWQVSDASACRLALAMWLTMGYVDKRLQRVVQTHVTRTAQAFGSGSDAYIDGLNLMEDTGFSACQGFAALVAPVVDRLHINSRAIEVNRQPLEAVEADGMAMWLELHVDFSNRESGEHHGEDLARQHFRIGFLRATKRPSPPELPSLGEHLARWLARERAGHADLITCLANVRATLDKGDKAVSSCVAEGRAGIIEQLRRVTTSSESARGNFDASFRTPALCDLLLPSLHPRSAPPATAQTRYLTRLLRRQRLQPILGHRTASPVIIDVAVLLEPALPVAFLIDDTSARKHVLQQGSEVTAEIENPPLTPEAAMRGLLLALDGWVVVRIASSDIDKLKDASTNLQSLKTSGAELVGSQLVHGIVTAAGFWNHPLM